MIDLSLFIQEIPNFPKAGILFRDITPLLKAPEAFKETLKRLREKVENSKAEAIIGIESRGFIFGAPIAAELNLPFIPVRKPGKLPAAKLSVEYALEYGNNQLDIHTDALIPKQKVVIIDDLLATGGTARAACKLTEMLQAEVVALLFVIELSALDGRKSLEPYPVHSLLRYD